MMPKVRPHPLHWLVAVAAVAAPWGAAHGVTRDADLAGRRACLVGDGVEVRVAARDPATPAGTFGEAASAVAALFAGFETRYGVPLAAAEACEATDLGLQVEIRLRWLDPEGYVGFGDHAYSYDLRVVAAERHTFDGAGDHANEAAAFLTRATGIHRPEASDVELTEELANLSRRGLETFVAAWWEDAGAPTGTTGPTRPGVRALGIVLALLVVVSIWRASARPSTPSRGSTPRDLAPAGTPAAVRATRFASSPATTRTASPPATPRASRQEGPIG